MLAITWAEYAFGQSSVLQTGAWRKFAVEKNGVYKITFDALRKAGLDPAATDPRKIRLFGNEGGMLPQANSAERPDDLTELAIFVRGEADGVFNSDDYILFYAEGPDKVSYRPDNNTFAYEHNLYASQNYYFLTVGSNDGKRIVSRSSLDAQGFPVIREFNDFVFHETDTHNELRSGREWFGEKFDITTSHLLSWDIRGILENSTIKVVSDVMAQSSSGSSFNLYLNDIPVGEQYVLPIPGAQYAQKGQSRHDTLTIDAAPIVLANNTKLEARYQYNKAGAGRSVGYLNFLLISFERTLALYDEQTLFRSASSVNSSHATFAIASSSSPVTAIWDITNPYEPVSQEFSGNGSEASFTTETGSLREFVAFSDKVPEPEFAGEVANQNLHGMATPDLLIVTTPLFLASAQQLATHRSNQSSWTVGVVTTEEIFNEFSSGRPDLTAIRDFAKHLYDKSPNLRAMLLFGRSSFDYKDRLENNTNFVPTYESRNSLHPLNTYSSDDYFGFLEDAEGEWDEVSGVGNHTMDIAIGRLPVKTEKEAADVVNKIIEYETGRSTYGNWRKKIVFVADDGDVNTHQNQADQMATEISLNHPEIDTRKIYLDAFEQVRLPAGEASPDTEKKLLEALDRGALIINYTGHGNERQWAHERIFDDFVIETLANQTFPLFVTATCEFGRHDDPAQISGAEMCVLRRNGGAIGMVTTARPVEASTNFALNKAFYQALFEAEAVAPATLGEVFRKTKNASLSGVSNRNFSLLADPSMPLVLPKLRIQVTEVIAGNTTDTLRALSHVTIRGEVVGENQERVTEFNGILEANVFDKETEITTLGNENQPYTYREWSNALYQGRAKVTDGEFEFEFVVTKNIAYQLGNGKLSLYAYDEDAGLDAAGATMDFVVGESEAGADADNESPQLAVFIGDTTFRNGGIASPDTRLLVKLSDDNGINISGYGIGNSLVAILDDSISYNLNEYYVTDVGDFTHGSVDFPLKDLAPGRHRIVVKAWDTHNNPAVQATDFVVSDGNDLVIEHFGNYPNPFTTSTTLFFTHNRSGDDLATMLAIYDVTGRLLKTQELSIPGSPYEVELLELDTRDEFWKNLKGGLYLARLIVRSVTNGSKNEQVTKLIVTN